MSRRKAKMSVINNVEGMFVIENFAVNFDDFENTCRSCLAKDGVVNLFQTIHEGTPLREIYETLLVSAQVHEGDRLPAKLCSSCVTFVKQYYTFRKRALDSEIILQQAVCKIEEQDPLADGNDDRNECKIEIVIESDCEIKPEVFESVLHDQAVLRDHDYSKSSNLPEEELLEVAKVKDTKKKVKNKLELLPKKSAKKKVKNELELVTNKSEKKNPSRTDTNITCSFCKNIFPTFQEYVVHRKKEAGKRRKKLPCKYCNRLVKNTILKDHMNTHTKEQPYQCDVCGAKFSMASSLIRHKYRHSDKKPLECKICGKGFIQSALLEDHVRKHTGEKPICFICGKVFSASGSLDIHIKRHNSEEEIINSRINSDTEGSVNCNICEKTFSSGRKLKAHMNTHCDRKFTCNVCGKKFRTQSALKTHSRNHSGIKPHACKTCGKGFMHKSQLPLHNLTHTGEKPLPCVFCGRRFAWKPNLDIHMRIHTGERPYQCTVCNRGFRRSDYLKNHMRTHTKEKPFICDVCPKAYRYLDSLKKHKRTHEV